MRSPGPPPWEDADLRTGSAGAALVLLGPASCRRARQRRHRTPADIGCAAVRRFDRFRVLLGPRRDGGLGFRGHQRPTRPLPRQGRPSQLRSGQPDRPRERATDRAAGVHHHLHRDVHALRLPGFTLDGPESNGTTPYPPIRHQATPTLVTLRRRRAPTPPSRSSPVPTCATQGPHGCRHGCEPSCPTVGSTPLSVAWAGGSVDNGQGGSTHPGTSVGVLRPGAS